MDLSIGSVLDVLVLKNDAECTSQRLKRTSGARVLIFCSWLLVISSSLHSQNMPGEMSCKSHTHLGEPVPRGTRGTGSPQLRYTISLPVL